MPNSTDATVALIVSRPWPRQRIASTTAWRPRRTRRLARWSSSPSIPSAPIPQPQRHPALDLSPRAGGVHACADDRPLTLPAHASISGLLPPRTGLARDGCPPGPPWRRCCARMAIAPPFVSAFVLDRHSGCPRASDVRRSRRARSCRGAAARAERPGAQTIDAALAWLLPSTPRATSSSCGSPFGRTPLFAARRCARSASVTETAGSCLRQRCRLRRRAAARLIERVNSAAGRACVDRRRDHGERSRPRRADTWHARL